MTIGVGLIVEDVRFADFLAAAVPKLAGAGRELDLLVEKTSGCRPRKLREIHERVRARCAVLVVGADAKRDGRTTTHRQKARGLRGLLPESPTLVPATAHPCVEAWLYADPSAFARGIESGTGVRFRRPAEWPVPRSERQAKDQLGRLIRDGCGGPLLRGGFEFAPEIVAHLDLPNSRNPSLAQWARDFLGMLASLEATE